MAKQPVQQIPIRQSSGGGGGGGSPASLAQVAIANFINDQGQAQKKMMDNFGKLQEVQAAQAAESSRQQTAAMNRVAAQEDEKTKREERLQDKLGDREHQEKFFEFTQTFQAQAAKDFAAVQTRVAGQMAAGRDFITRMDQNRVEFGDRIRGMRQALHNPELTDYWNNTPGGRERLGEMNRNLRLAELYHEQDQHSTYTGEVQQKMAEIQEQILAGEGHEDLSPLLTLSPSSVLGKDFSDEDLEELYHSGGYPPGGLFGRDPDDPAIKKYKDFNPMDYMSNMWMLEDEQFFSMVDDRKMQDDYLAMRMETFKDRKEALTKLQTFSNQDYDRLERTAVEGAYFGVQGFIDDLVTGGVEAMTGQTVLKSGDFTGQGRTDAMATKLLESVFVSIAGPGSENQLAVLDSLLKGEGDKGILDTEVELSMGFHLRNVLRHIDNNLLAMTIAPASTKEGGAAQLSSSLQIARFITTMPASEEKDQLARSLLMVPGDVSRGRLLQPPRGRRGGRGELVYDVEMEGLLHSGVERMFKTAQQKVKDLHDLVEAQPALVGYRNEQGSTQRYTDAIVASWFSGHPTQDAGDEGAQERAFAGASTEDFRSGLDEIGEGTTEGFDIENLTLRQAVRLSPLQAASELVASHTSRPELISALFSGDYDLAPVMFKEGADSGAMMESLKLHRGRSKSRRDKVSAEIKQRREAREKRQSLPGESGPGQQIPLGDEPSEN